MNFIKLQVFSLKCTQYSTFSKHDQLDKTYFVYEVHVKLPLDHILSEMYMIHMCDMCENLFSSTPFKLALCMGFK